MQQYCKVTGIKQIRTSPYHPQTDGMVERFNSTLKRLLRKLTQDPKVEWDRCLPYVLWAYRGTVHKTTGFSPYHLLFGKEMRMPLDQMVRYWKGKETNDETGVVEFIQTLKANMEAVRDLAYERESEEKEKQKHYHDLTAKDRVFAVGDFVLVFRPGKQDTLQNQWQVSFPITEKVTDVTYKVDLGTKIKRYRIFHVNCMRQWTSPASAVFLAQDTDEEDLEIEEEEKYTHIMQDSHHIDIEELKKKYKDVLQDVPGRTTLVQHDIPTGDAVPIRFPPYRLAHHSQEMLREEIRTLLDQGIIRPSKSPWAAPIVLVKKKDGTQRMCVDYRKLNKVTGNDPYPLPNIEELIANLGSSRFITTLDLTKGYYQVPVTPKHQEKTAFGTPYRKYGFVTMPFGLISAPSTFQRLMDEVLDGLHEFTVAYLDDILIHSQTWDQHMKHLDTVFTKLRKAGLNVKERKCTFASGSCVYLGHVVGNGSVKPMDCKVSAVKNFREPQTKKDVRWFLGLCGYYRKFVPNFSTVAAPLSELTRKNMPKKVIWTTKCDQAFLELKEALTRAPILMTPDWTLPFILQTDASSTGLGYVLSQVNSKGEEHPIAFASKKLLPSERNYSAIEREALAIVKGIKHFRTYLEGTTFTIQTDHNPLTHLGNLKDSHGRLARWALSLQPYDFTIVHRSGKLNSNVYGLSRDQGSLSKVGGMSGAPTLTVCEREGRNEMEEQEANDQNKSPEAPRDYKLPEACNLLDEQMKDSDWLVT